MNGPRRLARGASLATFLLCGASRGAVSGVEESAAQAAAAVASPDQATALARTAPAPEVREPDGPRVTVSGFAQIDWVIHRQSSEDELDPSTGEPLNADRILLRRGRLRAATRYKSIAGHLELEATTVTKPTVQPYEAVLSYVFPDNAEDRSYDRYQPSNGTTHDVAARTEWSVTASLGLMPIPFGQDPRTLATRRLFLEHTTTTRALFGLARDFGAGLDARYRFVHVAAAVMNGEPLSEDGYAGRDLTSAKDIVGRAGVVLPLGDDVEVEAGASFLTGTGLHRGTRATKDTLSWIDGNENGQIEVSELVSVAGAPATESRTFSRGAVGADLGVSVNVAPLGHLTLRGELTWAKNLDRTLYPADPLATGRDLRELGVSVGATQELTRYAQVGIRYEHYDPDADARRQQGARVVPLDAAYATWSFTVSGRLPPGRLVLQYDHNDNSLGRSPSGQPTRLRDDALTLRGEIVF